MASRKPFWAAAATVLLAAAWTGPVQAAPDAKVDQQVRPSFGVLLQPPIKHRYRPRAWTPRRPAGPGYGYPGRPRRSLGLNSIAVDCSAGGAPGALSDAVYHLADQGVLYIRSGGACQETLEIDHPIVVVGESLPSFAAGPAPMRARLVAPAGAPCVRIAPGVKGVVIRDLIIDGSQSGRSACIEAEDADLAMDRVKVTYSGDASAIFMLGGALIVQNSTIEARSNDAAVTVEGVRMRMERTRVLADVRGFDIIPATGRSELVQVGVIAQGAGLPGSTGITLRDTRSGSGTLAITNSVIKGWLTGIYVDRGGKLEMAYTRILDARRGIVSDWGEVRMGRSAVQANERGAVFAGAGSKPVVEYNRFVVGRPEYEPGITPETQPNWLYLPDCTHFPFGTNGVHCRLAHEAPRGLQDETGFADTEVGWGADGYQLGYARDGQPTVCRPGPGAPPPPRRRYRRQQQAYAPAPPVPPVCAPAY